MSIVTVDKENFASKVAAGEPILLDFWAAWCGPCRSMLPGLEAFARENTGRVTVGKVDVDTQTELAAQHGITSIPTLVVYKNGQIMDRISGARSKADLEAFVAPYVNQ